MILDFFEKLFPILSKKMIYHSIEGRERGRGRDENFLGRFWEERRQEKKKRREKKERMRDLIRS